MKTRFCIVLVASLAVSVSNSLAQVKLGPDAPDIKRSALRSGIAEFSYNVRDNSQLREMGVFVIETTLIGNRFTLATRLNLGSGSNTWIDTSIVEAQTLKPVYRSSYNPDREMSLRYGSEITGHYRDRKTGKSTAVRQKTVLGFFDDNFYPYLLSLLPLSTGYKADIAVFDYKPNQTQHLKKTQIEEVVTSQFKSQLTGDHAVWRVSVFEEATKDRYVYFIDKEDGRIWKIEVASKGTNLVLINREIDYNPFTNKFNKQETLRLIKDGNASISGKAYARDNQNEGILKGMAILNVNKKQYAREGTSIILIPYTPFFKEWIKLNEKTRKEGRAVPLPPEAAECIKTTTVYGEDGEFEFTNLMPGEYLLYTEFGYAHTSIRTEVVGYTDTYINGMFVGSSARTSTYAVGTNAVAGIKKVVEIRKPTETVKVKLKKTL